MPEQDSNGNDLTPMTGRRKDDGPFDAERHFPQEWHTGIREAIREGISAGLANHCRVPLVDEEMPHIRMMMNGIKDFGKGSAYHGIDEMMENHKFVQSYRNSEETKEQKKDHEWARRQRARFDSAAKRLGGTLITFGVAAFFTLIGFGIKEWIDTMKSAN